MKSLEDHIFSIDGENLKQNPLQEDLAHNRIEEIILKSIDDQESLFSQTFFQPEDSKKYYHETYTKEIIDMCSTYSFDNDDGYSLPEIQKQLPTPGACRSGERKMVRVRTDKEGDSLDNRPFICTYSACFKAFKRFEHLKRHYRIHTGERPYKCPMRGCTKAFSRSDNLMQHSKTHANRKFQEY